ncbi:hypothetical protein V1525DRAFT_436646 [Lipomyces kononenkoae]|uniref:Uncharacterized protein n=1 Tax=Lipomyces kononenkoae TaxID=34357 RepID=A0ACC3TBK6_LIPKO
MKSPSMSNRDGWQSRNHYLPHSQPHGGEQYRDGHISEEISHSSYIGEYRQPQSYQSYGRRPSEALPPSLAPISREQSSDYSKFDEDRIQPQPQQNSQNFLHEVQSNSQLSPGHVRRPSLATIDPLMSTSESHQVLSLEQYHRRQQQYHRGSMVVPLPALSQAQHSQRLQPHPYLQHGENTSMPPLAPLATRTPSYGRDFQLLAPVSPHKSPKSTISSPATRPALALESEVQRQDKALQLEVARHKSSIAALVSPPLSADRHRSPSVSSPLLSLQEPSTSQRQHAHCSPPNGTYEQEPQQSSIVEVSPQLPSIVVTGAPCAPAKSAVTLPEFSQQQDGQLEARNLRELKPKSTEGTEPLLVEPQDSLSSGHNNSAGIHSKKRKSNTVRDEIKSRKVSIKDIASRERFRPIAPAPSTDKRPAEKVSSAKSRTLPPCATSRPLRTLLPAQARASANATQMTDEVPSSRSVSAPLETTTVAVMSSASSSSPTSTTTTSGSSSSSPRSLSAVLGPTPPASTQLEVSKLANTRGLDHTTMQSTDKPFGALPELHPARPAALESSMRTSMNPSKSPAALSSVLLSKPLHASKPVHPSSDSAVADSSSNGMVATTVRNSVPSASMSAASPVAVPVGGDNSIASREQKDSTEPSAATSVTSEAAVVSAGKESTLPQLARPNEQAVDSCVSIRQQSSTVEPLGVEKNSESTSGHDSSSKSSVHVAVTDSKHTKTRNPHTVSTPPSEASASTAKGKFVKKMRMGPKSTSSPITVVPISRKRMAELGESEDSSSDEEGENHGPSTGLDIRSNKHERVDVDEGGESEDESLVHSVKREKRFHPDEASESKDSGIESKSSTVSGAVDNLAGDGRTKTKFEHNFSAETAFDELLAAGKNLRKALALTAPSTSEDRETSNAKKQLDFTEVALHNGREHITQLKISRDTREMCRQSWLRSVIKGRAELSSKQNNSILRLRQWLKWWWADIAARHSENQLQGSWGKRTQISKAWQAAYDVSASIVHARLRQCERVYELQYRCGWPALVLATMTTPALGPTQRMRKSHLERGCDATQISQKDWSEFIALAESRVNEIRNVVLNECGYDGIRRILEKAAVTKPFALQSLALFPPYSYAEDEETIVVMPRTMMRNTKVVFDKRKKSKNVDKKTRSK